MSQCEYPVLGSHSHPRHRQSRRWRVLSIHGGWQVVRIINRTDLTRTANPHHVCSIYYSHRLAGCRVGPSLWGLIHCSQSHIVKKAPLHAKARFGRILDPSKLTAGIPNGNTRQEKLAWYFSPSRNSKRVFSIPALNPALFRPTIRRQRRLLERSQYTDYIFSTPLR